MLQLNPLEVSANFLFLRLVCFEFCLLRVSGLHWPRIAIQDPQILVEASSPEAHLRGAKAVGLRYAVVLRVMPARLHECLLQLELKLGWTLLRFGMMAILWHLLRRVRAALLHLQRGLHRMLAAFLLWYLVVSLRAHLRRRLGLLAHSLVREGWHLLREHRHLVYVSFDPLWLNDGPGSSESILHWEDRDLVQSLSILHELA